MGSLQTANYGKFRAALIATAGRNGTIVVTGVRECRPPHLDSFVRRIARIMDHAVDHNPLLADAPGAWDRLIESVGPASLLVVIEQRMSDALKRHLTPE